MRIKRLLSGLAAATLVVAACPSRNASPAPTGWELVGQRPNGLWPALHITPAGDTALSVVIVVSGGCPAGGPATPSFSGFTTNGEIIQAVISRQPIPDHCIVHDGVEFDVRLDLTAVPNSARTMVLGGEACPVGDDICTATTAPMPLEVLAGPSG